MSFSFVELGKVADINPRLPKDADETQMVSFLTMSSVSEKGEILNQEDRVLSEVKKGFTYFERNDVLLAKITPCFENGKAVYVDKLSHKIGYGSTEFHVLRPNSDLLDAKYLFYMVWNDRFRFLGEKAMKGAAGQKRVGADYLKEFKIPLPSLSEQKRIAAILDKADAIRRKRQQAIQLADDFLRAVFLDMFGDPMTNPKGWEEKKWQDVLVIINGKNQRKVEALNGKYPIYGSGGKMGFADDYLCNENTVIIDRKGNINKPILVKEKFWNVDTAFGLSAKTDKLSFHYLYWFCLFFNFEKLNKTVTIPSLTKSDLLEIYLPLPPLQDQNIFAEICEKVSGLLVKSRNSLELSHNKFSSISQNAFSGQL